MPKLAFNNATTPRAATLRYRTLPHFAGLEPPAYQSAGAAGLDLPAAVAADVVLAPGARAAIPTGLEMVIPAGFEGQVRPRSGLALNHGVTCLNTPGTIDSDYRGEIKVILINHGSEPFTVRRGMRIAQLVITPVVQLPITESSDLDATPRGGGGFGSTGT